MTGIKITSKIEIIIIIIQNTHSSTYCNAKVKRTQLIRLFR